MPNSMVVPLGFLSRVTDANIALQSVERQAVSVPGSRSTAACRAASQGRLLHGNRDHACSTLDWKFYI
jgi:hypothetical protein